MDAYKSVEDKVESSSVEDESVIVDAELGAASFSDKASELEPLTGWRQPVHVKSLAEVHASIDVPLPSASFWKKLSAFAGVGLMVSIGYMDPGNWATDIAGGSEFGYTLLFVIMLSSIAAMFLQHLSLKLGVAAERDLAQACRDAYPAWACKALWLLAEIAIVACDLAEVIGSAVAIYLLTGWPLWAGVLITAADVLIVLLFEMKNFRLLEAFLGALILVITGCFIFELAVASPDWRGVASGFIPRAKVLTNPDMLFVAIGILGATVMPHNLYLHSSVVQTRAYPRTKEGKQYAIRFATIDSSLSLFAAFFINASILILAAAAFHYGKGGKVEVAGITEAYKLLSTSLGAKAASIVFAVALLASGQNSTVTATIAGQVVMEGFLQMRLKPWVRRLVTRSLAIVPAVIVAAVMGNKAVSQLLVISQVILSLQLSFAVIPLVHFTSCKKYMGRFSNSRLVAVIAAILALIIAGLNGYMFVSTFIHKSWNA